VKERREDAMEVLFVYGLVLLFFILVPLFVVGIISTHPYTEPAKMALTDKTATVHASSLQQRSSSTMERKIAYAALAVIVIGLCVIAVLSERRSGSAAIQS
jgi:peptidoglycan biosynthesis protein MviN/MurJ (putative lipid II flippase)